MPRIRCMATQKVVHPLRHKIQASLEDALDSVDLSRGDAAERVLKHAGWRVEVTDPQLSDSDVFDWLIGLGDEQHSLGRDMHRATGYTGHAWVDGWNQVLSLHYGW